MKKRIAALTIALLLLIPTALFAAAGFAARFSDRGIFSLFYSLREHAVAQSLGKEEPAVCPVQENLRGERYIIAFKDSVPLKEIEKAFSAEGIDAYPLAGSDRKLFAADADRGFCEKYAGMIEYCEEDVQRAVLSYPDDPVRTAAYESVGIYEAFDLTEIDPGLIIAVLDTGISRGHEDLAGANILPGYNAVGRTAGVYEDSSGHGTAVTGIIAAVSGNKTGISGVAHGATVLPVKISSTRSTIYSSDLISGIRFAADAGAKIINMSVGGYSYSYAEQEAVNYALGKGCILIAAAGNEGNRSYAGQKCYPASYDGVISVASCSDEGRHSDFSQYNECVDVSAPGENITVPVWSDGISVYTNDSGTSYSAAIVSGIAAMVISDIGKDVKFGGKEFLAVITDTLGPERTDRLGYGMINAPDVIKRARKPVITGVTDGGTYSETVTVGFNYGEGYLDGERIYSGETVVTNGKHTVVVTDGENTVSATFRLNYSPLSAKYREYSDRAVFEFDRGFALLDGFPYVSGTPITDSGTHRFRLIGDDEEYMRVIETRFALPEITGVEDGGVYDRAVGIRITGGEGYLDGNLAGDVFAVHEPGEHTVTVRSGNGKRTKTVRFTVTGENIKTFKGDLSEPNITVDGEKGFIVYTGDNLSGARISLLDSPNEVFRIIESSGVSSASVTKGNLLLLGEGIGVYDRGKILSGEDALINEYKFEGSVCCFADSENAGFITADGRVFLVDPETGTPTQAGALNALISDAVCVSGTVCAIDALREGTVHLLDLATGEVSTLYTDREISRADLLFDGRYICVGNRVFSAADAEPLAEFYGWHAVALNGGMVFSDVGIFDIASGETVGLFQKDVCGIYFGVEKNLVFFSDGDSAEVDNTADVPGAFCAGEFISTVLSPGERSDGYRTVFRHSSGLKISALSAYSAGICFTAEDEKYLYTLEDGGKNAGSYALRFIPDGVIVSEGFVCVTFDSAPYVYFAPENAIGEGVYIPVGEKCGCAVYTEGKIFAVADRKIVVYDISAGTLHASGIECQSIAAAGGHIGALKGRELSLYTLDLAKLASVFTGGGTLTGGEVFSVGGQVYSPLDVTRIGTLRGTVLAVSDGAAVTDSGVFLIASGEKIGDLPVSEVDFAAICGSGTLFAAGDDCVAAVSYGDGTPFFLLPEVSGIGDGGSYRESAKIEFGGGMGFIDGVQVESGAEVTAHGKHRFILSLPCGVGKILDFTVVPKLSGIEFPVAVRNMNVGESITLRLKYLPDGANSQRASFTADKEGVSVDGSGVLKAEAVGSYLITAEVEVDGSRYSAQCRVNVRDDLIVFSADSGIRVDRNGNYIFGISPGTDAETLKELLQTGRRAEVTTQEGSLREGILHTGDLLTLYNGEGGISDSLTVIIYGDTDGDGYLTARDLRELERILKGYEYADRFVAAADADGNGINTNGDFYRLRGLLTGRIEGTTGTPEQALTGECGIQTVTFVEEGGYIDAAIYISGSKYARAVSGTIKYEGLEFVSAESLEWEFGLYDFGGSLGFYAFSESDEEAGRSFRTIASIRFRVTGKAGGKISFTSDGLTVNSHDESAVLPFVSAERDIRVAEYGETEIIISNGKRFEFSADKNDFFALIPYNSSIADVKVIRPEGCTVTVDGTVISDGGSGTVNISVNFPDGSSKYYSVRVRREDFPSFDSNCLLSRLEVEGFRLDPGFDPKVTEYVIRVPFGTEKINVYSVAQSKKARIITGDTLVTGDETVVNVTVIAEDGETLRYKIKVLRDSAPEVSSNENSGSGEESESEGDGVSASVYVLIAAAIAAAAAAIYFIKRKKSVK